MNNGVSGKQVYVGRGRGCAGGVSDGGYVSTEDVTGPKDLSESNRFKLYSNQILLVKINIHIQYLMHRTAFIDID